MNGAFLLCVGAGLLALAYVVYGRFLSRLFGVDPQRPTPAHTLKDGVDYVPTKAPVLFGHHFASIAGAGPIVGPVLAAYFGWLPVALWIVLGCVFVGAMHDFAALFLSVRDEGRSIGHVIERQIGYTGRQIFLLFSWAALILVVAIFGLLVARTFVATPAVATASLLFIGMAPAFGYLVYRKGVSIRAGSFVFVPLLFLAIWVGTKAPLDLEALLGFSPAVAKQVWLVVLLAYAFVASTIPVWLLLQPRDYLNSYLLYAMMAVGFVGILVVRPTLSLPAFEGMAAVGPDGRSLSLFPLLFVTVACGACSGFHALVASGTTAKQIDNERHIQPIGYGGMIVEGVLALMALVSVGVLSGGEYAEVLKAKGAVGAFAGGLAGFAEHIGLPAEVGGTFIAMAISAFMLTTLDTATRLTRFTWQELFLPASGPPGEPAKNAPASSALSNRYVATAVVVVVAGSLAATGSAGEIWPVFGASNQLLAALTLLVVTLVLVRRGKNFLVSLFPMAFMMVVCMWALVNLLVGNLTAEVVNWTLVVATVFLILMALVLAGLATMALKQVRREQD